MKLAKDFASRLEMRFIGVPHSASSTEASRRLYRSMTAVSQPAQLRNPQRRRSRAIWHGRYYKSFQRSCIHAHIA